jgi:DNA-directed RNA polymerase subunit RPC12/RpoP
MELSDPFVCPKCAGHSEYGGRIGLPAQVIYRCSDCGHETWVAYRPDTTPPERPAMQQQQPQPKNVDDE